MRIKAILFCLLISKAGIAQQTLDNILFVTFPQKAEWFQGKYGISSEKLSAFQFEDSAPRPDINGIPESLMDPFQEQEFEEFELEILDLDMEGYTIENLPANENQLEAWYKAFTKLYKPISTYQLTVEFGKEKALKVDSYLGYNRELMQKETGKRIGKMLYLLLNKKLYILTYRSNKKFNSKRQNDFFSSITIKSNEKTSQFVSNSFWDELSWNKKGKPYFGAVLLLAIVVFIVFQILKLQRRKTG